MTAALFAYPSLFYTALVLAGLALGSLLNTITLRHEKGERLSGRSRCMSCAHELSWYELIPVVSYLIQGRKCRSCSSTISPQYPLVELATALLFVLVGYVVEPFAAPLLSMGLLVLVVHLCIWSLLMASTVYDLRTKLIPDSFSYTFALLAFAALFITPSGFLVPGLWELLAGPVCFLPFYVLWAVSQGRWIGLGDGKLSLGIGWLLGLPLAGTAILTAFWLGAVVSLALIALQRVLHTGDAQLTMKSAVPFGPFLVLGTLVIYVYQIDLFSYLL
jgi:prepilin signal peptidase PulO-like enzyme (type II secretory pathway)